MGFIGYFKTQWRLADWSVLEYETESSETEASGKFNASVFEADYKHQSIQIPRNEA
jgi:hypothetical protein